jgi:hypothetical protein
MKLAFTLWGLALILLVMTLTTIDCPPTVVWNPSQAARDGLGIGTLVVAVAATIVSQRIKKKAANNSGSESLD